MGMGHYRLGDNHEVVREDDLLSWAAWMENADRRVYLTLVGPYRISTVFLGLDHNFGSGPPLLFETMCFDGDDEEVNCLRYETWEQAERGHKEIVRRMIEIYEPQWLLDRDYKLLGVEENVEDSLDET